MSGAAGHLSHPYEDLNTTFQELVELIQDAAAGKLDEVSEKTDGINLSFSLIAGELRVSRNKSQMRSGGLNREALRLFFDGRKGIQKAFLDGFDALQEVCSVINKAGSGGKLSTPAGQVWMSAEILSPHAHITLQYDLPAVVVHAAAKLVDRQGNISDYEGPIAAQVSKLANQANVPGWLCTGAIPVHLSVMDMVARDKAVADLHRLCAGNPLKTVRQYAAEQKPGLFRAPEKERASLLKQALSPLERVIFAFAVERLRGLTSSMISDGDKELTRIRNKVMDVVRQVESSGDTKAIEKLKFEMSRLKSMDDISAPIEGIVFRRNGKLMKFTGAFAAFHQIVSIPSFSSAGLTKENMKPIKESKFDLSVMDRIREAVETDNVSVTTALQLERYLTAGYISLSEAHAILDKASALSHSCHESDVMAMNESDRPVVSADSKARQKAFCQRLKALSQRTPSQDPVPEDPESCIKRALKRWKSRCK